MAIYITVFLITFIFSLFAKSEYQRYLCYKDLYLDYNSVYNIKRRNDYYIRYLLLLALSTMILGLVSGLRGPSVGTDVNYTYLPNFNHFLLGSQKEYTEVGFNYLNRFILLFTSNGQALIIITSLIFSSSLIRISIKYSKSVAVSLLVAFLSTIYFVSLNNIRQSIAAIIVLEAYPYLVDKKLVKYIIVTLIATIFHISALIAIPVYFVVNNDIVRKYLFSFCLTLCILLPILAKFALYLISHTKYEYFLVSEFNNGDVNTVNIIYGFVYFVISFILLYKDRMRYKEVYVLLIMQFLYFFVSIISIFIPVSEMISRIASYFLYYQILLIPYIVYREYKISGKIIFLTFYTLTYGIYMVYFIVLKGYHSVLPFKFCF